MLSLQEAKNKFSAVVEAALAGHPQRVSRRGKPAVVVLAADEYTRLVDAAKARRESFQDHLLSYPEMDFSRAGSKPRDVEF
ncbi:type II toxin-antitoxin system Phd/YefM family antitoxin [Paracoccus sp. Z330]|uniref:Antitoxin n=1 Tax=Paracoccus onchidii TaxID=3017813 RepID=A0ABT4ZFV8_9RHOB|nr:type II toxin-antitoxin system Phd/YefM family antitoxin [Paracoccus onchidii]MDB6178255.1 type II toxin-antitoxin system Phd/YefM family antitoxin [Paracoccus onchidii]